MANHPKLSAKNETGETRRKSELDPRTTPDQKMAAFQEGLRSVLNCSKQQLKSALEYERSINAGKPKRGPKPSASARASRAKG
jgi:hypothetical protein